MVQLQNKPIVFKQTLTAEFPNSNSIYIYIYIYIYISIPTPLPWVGCNTRSIFKCSLTNLNSDFSFSQIGCQTKVKKLSLFYSLSIAGREIVGWISFPRLLQLCEMQTATSKIWTWTNMSIFYNDNHYSTKLILQAYLNGIDLLLIL